ncbi:MAG: hypothetical protein SPK50_08300 [Mobiluncus porci]|uniref:Uncharacterized protein n=1 Tax=Mobiluncus porci TaxID=2652278 RepID=A0A7K0K476_9ACTO|nr:MULTISPECIES: hypothetical protein [Mobiluncus]MCI6584158.1 hypothetical protein [Mobiluncus sp.]MDD7542314.1 hypothetical protein [Mobiluncus porci]MDY5749113.1 hypothetical protein [Mobiluncus porci]MST49835.1 hypothetical protein [Mobiluncus porci]
MQLFLVAMWWVIALVLAIALVVSARPRRLSTRFHTHVYVKDVEALSPDDVRRTHPYEVTVLIPAWENSHLGEFHELTLNPKDLNPGRARDALRFRRPLGAWVSSLDPRDLVFTKQESWNTNRVINAVLVLVAQFVATGASLLHLELISTADPWFVVMFPLIIGGFTYLMGLGFIHFIRALVVWVRLSSQPVTVPARITGVRQAVGHQGGFEVSLLWAPLGMPTQYSTIRVPSTRRRTLLLLQKLINNQLEEEAAGHFRVQVERPETPPQTAVSMLQTPQGPATIKITALPSSDPRSDPRPPKARAAAEKARAKREAELLAQREAFEKSTAKARIEAASQAELGSPSLGLDELAAEGPQAWYYPLNPGRVNLVGFNTGASQRGRLAGVAFLWFLVALGAGAAVAYLGFIHPETLFPVYVHPNPDYEPLGKWE